MLNPPAHTLPSASARKMIIQGKGSVRPPVATAARTHWSLPQPHMQGMSRAVWSCCLLARFHRVSGLWLFELGTYSTVLPLDSSQAGTDGWWSHGGAHVLPRNNAFDNSYRSAALKHSKQHIHLFLCCSCLENLEACSACTCNNQFPDWPAVLSTDWLLHCLSRFLSGILQSGTDNMQTGQDRSCSCRVRAQCSVTVPFPFQSTQKGPKEERKSQKSM